MLIDLLFLATMINSSSDGVHLYEHIFMYVCLKQGWRVGVWRTKKVLNLQNKKKNLQGMYTRDEIETLKKKKLLFISICYLLSFYFTDLYYVSNFKCSLQLFQLAKGNVLCICLLWHHVMT